MSRRLFDYHSDSFEYRLFRLTLRISSAAAVISFFLWVVNYALMLLLLELGLLSQLLRIPDESGPVIPR